MTVRRLILLILGIGLVVLLACGATGLFVVPRLFATQPQTTQYQCANGQIQSSPCSAISQGTTPQPGVTNPPQQPTTQPQTGGIQLVATSNQPCPSTDFSLQQGIGSCALAAGKHVVCEGDLSDSLGVRHDSLASTGQVDEIDQTATIDGHDNGGTCHYIPPWTVQQSIDSVKSGCGGGCAKLFVYHDGQLVQTV